MKRFADVRFITALEAAQLYRDRARERKFTSDDVKTIAAHVTDDVSFQNHNGVLLSAAEVFALLNESVVGHGTDIVLPVGLLGPTGSAAPAADAVVADGSQLGRTAVDVADFIRKQGRIPSVVWLGSKAVTPESYVKGLAAVVAQLRQGKEMPKSVEFKPARLKVAQQVADDGPKLWGWVIFPRDFRAPAMMNLGKQQAWTLKPAHLDQTAVDRGP